MRPVIFYRIADMKPEELEAAKSAGFRTIHSRTMVETGELVVGRYSVLPFYRDTAADIELMGGHLINNVRQHHYIADMRNWVEDLAELTPKTWYRQEDISWDEPGSFVLKGQTNSRKEDWNSRMFAETRSDIGDVYWQLSMDGFIAHEGQDIYIREYIPLVTYAHGLNGLPITKEFRFFVARRQVLTGGFYWSSWEDTCLAENPEWKVPNVAEVPPDFLRKAIYRIGDKAEFYAMDVAQDITGRWWVIEINDGQQAGPSGNNVNILYKRLYDVLTGAAYRLARS
jgi:hypothetical protein